jgi:hypothetical protein
MNGNGNRYLLRFSKRIGGLLNIDEARLENPPRNEHIAIILIVNNTHSNNNSLRVFSMEYAS